MIEHQISIRIRYGETDKMGFVHHSNYALYLEEARMALLKLIGLDHNEIEESGVILPVVSMNIRFLSPIFFDDYITIKTCLKGQSEIKLEFHYEIYSESDKLLTKAETTLVFVDAKTKKLVQPPTVYLERMNVAALS